MTTFLAYIFLIIFAFVAGVIGGLWLARKDIARARRNAKAATLDAMTARHLKRLADQCAAHWFAQCEAMERAEGEWPEYLETK